MQTEDQIRELLVDAVLESDGGPDGEDGRYDAENIADDILRTYSGQELVAHIRRQTILDLFGRIPDGSDEPFKDQESQPAISYRMGWLAAKLWLKRQSEEIDLTPQLTVSADVE